MASGLVALLDDVAGLTKLAAASLDDVAGTTGRVGMKAAGVVIDDTAVTPRYVAGLTPDRELPIIGKIALGSIRNKLLILLPAALALSAFAPWAITPLLMAGGLYLCFEGAEKVAEALWHQDDHGEPEVAIVDPAALEAAKIKQAVRTDLILSAEIMAIALSDVADKSLLVQAIVLALVGAAITIGVYGVVGVIVKVDDVGVHLVRRGGTILRGLGRGLVVGMPRVMAALSVIGTAAMVWVGGGIVVHGLEVFGMAAIAHALHGAADVAAEAVPMLEGFVRWVVSSAGAGAIGLALGAAVVVLVTGWKRLRGTAATA